MNNNVLIITDGNREIGYGHISRCLIIAEEFKKNNFNVFFLHKKDTLFSERISDRFPVYEIDDYLPKFSTDIEAIIEEKEIKFVIIDLLEKEYRKLEWIRHKFSNIKIITITLFLFNLKDRYEHISFFPDLSKKTEELKAGKYDNYSLYTGSDYLLFRSEFEGLNKTIRNKARNVLVTMGGTDPKSITLEVVKALKSQKNLNLKIILSEIADCYSSVKEIAEDSKNIKLINKTNQISKLMVESDLAVINGGLTRYEVCLAKTPFIAISIHKRQFNITKQLTDLGVGINLGVYKNIESDTILKMVIGLLKNYERRKEMSDRMIKIFDTNGATRIFNKITG